MNKFLSQALSFVNSFLAILIIVGSGLAASNGGVNSTFVFGILGGFFVAILVCGTIALLLNIRDEIVLANKALNDLNAASGYNSSVSGGFHNTASGSGSSVSGGSNREASGLYNWKAGSKEQK